MACSLEGAPVTLKTRETYKNTLRLRLKGGNLQAETFDEIFISFYKLKLILTLT